MLYGFNLKKKIIMSPVRLPEPILDFPCVLLNVVKQVTGVLSGNTKYGMYELSDTILTIIYNTLPNGTFYNGFLAENCNFQAIKQKLGEMPNDLLGILQYCTFKNNIRGLVFDEKSEKYLPILEQNKSIKNSIANISGHVFETMSNRLFLGLKDCDSKTAEFTLQKNYAYLQSLIPTTPSTTTTLESPISVLSRGLKAAGIDLENFPNAEQLGNYIANLFGKTFTDPTTHFPPPTTENPSEENANEDGYEWGCIAVGVVGWTVALVLAGKIGRDWCNGKNKEQEIVNKNNNYKIDELKEIFIPNKDLLDTILKIQDLDDIIKMLDDSLYITNKSITPLKNQDSDLIELKKKLDSLNNEFKKLGSFNELINNKDIIPDILESMFSMIKFNNKPIDNNSITPYKIIIKEFASIVENIRNLANNNITIKNHFFLYEDSLSQLINIISIDSNYYSDLEDQQEVSLIAKSLHT